MTTQEEARVPERETLLTIQDLHVEFEREHDRVYAVNGVTIAVSAGEWVGVIGESGSGKSVTFLSILGLLEGNGRVTNGEVNLRGTNLLRLPKREVRNIRGRHVGYVFQNVASGLDPYIRVGDQVMEPMLQHRVYSRPEARERALQLITEVGIPHANQMFYRYPFELSGGMRQRVMIASALACEPVLLIADEPTTALDATVQVQVMSVLKKASRGRRMGTVLITHDMNLAANTCDTIVVLYGGQVMETGDLESFLHHAAHPYTLGLRDSTLEVGRQEPLRPIPGWATTLMEPPTGCPFAPRCEWADDICREQKPTLVRLSDTHTVACHHVSEVMTHGR